MKYLCIDTNIFIQCCALELEGGDDINSLKDLIKLLDNNKVKLLLPEIIEVEFYRKIEEKMKAIEDSINKYKTEISGDGALDKKIKSDMIKSLDKCIKERADNKLKVKKSIKQIFSHKNTLKAGMQINGELMAQSYKRALAGKKPSKKEEKFFINLDCLIIESIKKHLAKKKRYELYLCSQNKADFAENPEVKDGKFVISKDIKNEFSHIEYFITLINLLKGKFGVKYQAKEIEKFKEAVEDLTLRDFYSKLISERNYLFHNNAISLESPADSLTLTDIESQDKDVEQFCSVSQSVDSSAWPLTGVGSQTKKDVSPFYVDTSVASKISNATKEPLKKGKKESDKIKNI